MTVDIAGKDGAWIVTRDGRQVFGPVRNRFDAETAADRIAREARQRTRPCIRCRRDFTSTGPHHRMCTDCRHEARNTADGWV